MKNITDPNEDLRRSKGKKLSQYYSHRILTDEFWLSMFEEKEFLRRLFNFLENKEINKFIALYLYKKDYRIRNKVFIILKLQSSLQKKVFPS